MSHIPLTPLQATAEIRRILNSGGKVRASWHVEQDIQAPRDKGHDVSDDEVDHCLRNGQVLQNATREPGQKHWAYKVECRYDTHTLITVTAIFSEQNALRLITRWRHQEPYDRRKPKSPRKATK